MPVIRKQRPRRLTHLNQDTRNISHHRVGIRLSRPQRFLVALAAAAALLTGAGCGKDVDTLKPYTPAHGVNLDSADGKLQVRNLLIISDRPGEGILSTTVTTEVPDVLVGVSGNAIRADASTPPLTAQLTQPVPIQPYQPNVLTERSWITVRSAGLQAGLTAELVLQFRRAGELRIIAPVMNQDAPEYRTIEPPPPSPSTTLDAAG